MPFEDISMSYHTSARWVSLLKEGRIGKKDEPRPERKMTKHRCCDGIIIEKNARCTVEQIGEISGLNSPAIFMILNKA